MPVSIQVHKTWPFSLHFSLTSTSLEHTTPYRMLPQLVRRLRDGVVVLDARLLVPEPAEERLCFPGRED